MYEAIGRPLEHKGIHCIFKEAMIDNFDRTLTHPDVADLAALATAVAAAQLK